MSKADRDDVTKAAAAVDRAWIDASRSLAEPGQWVSFGSAAFTQAVTGATLFRLVPRPIRRFAWRWVGGSTARTALTALRLWMR